MGAAPDAAEVRVLGPVEVVGADGAAASLAPMHRKLLAALLVERGASRATDALIDALWPTAPPRSAPKLLQVYVSNLRSELPSSIRIATRVDGYALTFRDELLDAARFERLVRDARTARDDRNPALAASLLQRALELWRGEAYGDLRYEDFARCEAERLEDLRVAALEERLETALDLGRHAESLPEALSLAKAHPLRERLQADAMLALYRCGDQAGALELYRSARAALVDGLGLEPGPELRLLQRRILQQDPALAPPAQSLQAAARVLASPDSFVGRGADLDALRALFRCDDVRLIVLAGAGGSGKTRLALEAAARNAELFANGVTVVALAGMRDPGLVVAAIADALGLHRTGDPLESLTGALASRELLLVLDNAEQLRAGMGVLVEIVRRAPRVKILVTSRVVLHLSGEHVYPVDPLDTDAATELFVDRACAADARFRPAGANGAVIRRICQRLDCLPLAIELAAARVRTLALAELLDRLDARLPLLTGGPRDLPARQRTLGETIAWSFDLLDSDARRDFARLSVFAGGFTLDAAEAVTGATLESVSSLVDHHVVQRIGTAARSRYTMLETVREFAAEQLAACGESDSFRRRHFEHALDLARSLALSVEAAGSGVAQRHDIALAEQDNMRAALDWAAEVDPQLGLELALALELFWIASPSEGMRRLRQLLGRAGIVQPELRARALRDLGAASAVAGDSYGAERAYGESLALFERLRDESNVVRLRSRLGNIALARSDHVRARTLLEETQARARHGGYRLEESNCLAGLSCLACLEGRADLAFELAIEGLGIVRAHGGSPMGEAVHLANAAESCYHLGRLDEAEAFGSEAVAVSRAIADRVAIVWEIAILALCARARGNHEAAGRMWGAIEAEEERGFVGRFAGVRDDYARELVEGATPAFERGRDEGRRLGVDGLVAQIVDATPALAAGRAR
jgi:predicted ATPase/DNA-binding SARP family transcriptional activator